VTWSAIAHHPTVRTVLPGCDDRIVTLEPPESTYILLGALCDEFARCGMRVACTSPGSRNTPVILSLVGSERIRCFSHIDERCAGFFAVGAAKASAVPVAVTCTSGTAAAELAPAVTEAWHAHVPLIILTADRPAELRDLRAGQAIDQIKLYGGAVKWFSEVELPPADAAGVRFMRQLACRAYWTALQGPAGPVHLNLPLREPLTLAEPLDHRQLSTGRADGEPWVRVESGRGRAASVPSGLLDPRTVIVAGRVERDDSLQDRVTALAGRLRIPVLADAMSACRIGSTAIATYDLLLRDPELATPLVPAQILRIGDLPTSKPLRSWLASLGGATRQLIVDPERAWPDPDGVAQEIWSGDPIALVDSLERDGPPAADWLSRWTVADDAATAALRDGVAQTGELSEPLVAARLGEWLGPDVTLFVAASMPIRDVELYFPARAPLPRVLSNRGANGIDGTTSSAFGVAGAGEGSVVLLIGDVALLHDLGGLLAARRLGLELTIVVLNNDGGGIFDFLPVSESGGDAFAEHISTPHGTSMDRVAALFDLRHVTPHTETELHAAVSDGIGSGEVTLIEVRTDRAANLALHRRLAIAGLAAVAA
jgi:2-succinyl-5-enolpyruvyl-6-hydroxy-3-cyclohexene-1-carboxylate synthase